MKHLSRSTRLVSLIGLVAVLAPSARADSLGMDVKNGNLLSVTFTGTYGYSFTTGTALNISGLGVFDAGNNGLSAAHNVGIWNSSGVLLASVTVPSGTSQNQNIVSSGGKGSFRITNITPFSLAGGTYSIGAFYSTPGFADQTIVAGTAAPLAGVTYGSPFFNSGSSLAQPTNPQSRANAGYFGPTFVVSSAAAVPEPTFYALSSMLTLGGVGLLRQRKQASKSA